MITKEEEIQVRDFILGCGPYFQSSKSLCDYLGHDLELSCDSCAGVVICDMSSRSNHVSILNYINNEFKDEHPEYFL